MFPMRLILLFMALSMIWLNSAIGRDSNDKIDTILEFMVNMNKKVDKLTGTVDKLSDTEEISVMKVIKLEDAVQKIVKKEGEMEKQMGEMDSRLQKVNNNALISSLMSGWKFDDKGKRSIWEDYNSISTALAKGYKYYGRGWLGSSDDSISDFHKSFPQCVEMCNKKRESDGSAWNGISWEPQLTCTSNLSEYILYKFCLFVI